MYSFWGRELQRGVLLRGGGAAKPDVEEMTHRYPF